MRSLVSELQFLIIAFWVCPSRKDSYHFSTFLWTPAQSFKQYSSILWSTVSNASEKFQEDEKGGLPTIYYQQEILHHSHESYFCPIF